MNEISPRQVLARVAASVPAECHQNIIVIGSLAAGYHFFQGDQDLQVRTKDVDCVLFPRITAVQSAKAVAQKLLDAGWRPRTDGDHTQPGNASTPDDQLPAVRLHPPDSSDWFIELLLENEADLEEALVTCNTGLLASRQVTLEQLGLVGRRLLQDAIEPLAQRTKDRSQQDHESRR